MVAGRRQGRGQTVPIVVIGLGVLLLLGAGTLVAGPWLRADHTTSELSPPTAGPVGMTANGRHDPTGSVDEATRRAMVNGASMVLPADPFRIAPDPMRIDDVFDVYFLAEATVHPRTRTAPSWGAMVSLAHLDPAFEQTGADAMQTVTQHFFGPYPTRVSDVVSASIEVTGRTGVRLTGRAHYAVAGVSSRYDDVTAVVVVLADGSTVVAMTSVPDDAAAEVRRAAADSLRTLRVG